MPQAAFSTFGITGLVLDAVGVVALGPTLKHRFLLSRHQSSEWCPSSGLLVGRCSIADACVVGVLHCAADLGSGHERNLESVLWHLLSDAASSASLILLSLTVSP